MTYDHDGVPMIYNQTQTQSNLNNTPKFKVDKAYETIKPEIPFKSRKRIIL